MTDPISVRKFAQHIVDKIEAFDLRTHGFYKSHLIEIARDIVALTNAVDAVLKDARQEMELELEARDPQRLPPLLAEKKIDWGN